MIKNLVLVGCGHMGYAMLRTWVERKAAETIWVVTPEPETLRGYGNTLALAPANQAAICHAMMASALPENLNPDAIIFAVKPQILESVLAEYRRFQESLFLSVAAGKKLAIYTKVLGASARVVRVMPNLPAKVGAAASLLVAGKRAKPRDRAIAEMLFSMLGTVDWLPKENLMDTATALSGCGPAYFYLLADVMAKIGAEMHLPLELAARLSKQTLIGSAVLWQQDSESARTLYQNIAVKGGLTEAAILKLQDGDALEKLMRKALKAAAKRGKELSA